jgi:hypothetical protein
MAAARRRLRSGDTFALEISVFVLFAKESGAGEYLPALCWTELSPLSPAVLRLSPLQLGTNYPRQHWVCGRF